MTKHKERPVDEIGFDSKTATGKPFKVGARVMCVKRGPVVNGNRRTFVVLGMGVVTEEEAVPPADFFPVLAKTDRKLAKIRLDLEDRQIDVYSQEYTYMDASILEEGFLEYVIGLDLRCVAPDDDSVEAIINGDRIIRKYSERSVLDTPFGAAVIGAAQGPTEDFVDTPDFIAAERHATEVMHDLMAGKLETTAEEKGILHAHQVAHTAISDLLRHGGEALIDRAHACRHLADNQYYTLRADVPDDVICCPICFARSPELMEAVKAAPIGERFEIECPSGIHGKVTIVKKAHDEKEAIKGLPSDWDFAIPLAD